MQHKRVLAKIPTNSKISFPKTGNIISSAAHQFMKTAASVSIVLGGNSFLCLFCALLLFGN